MINKILFFSLLLLIGRLFAEDIDGFFFLKQPIQQAQGVSFDFALEPDLLQRAYTSILRHKTALGIETEADLVWRKITTDRFKNQHIHFGLVYQGLEIENMQIIVHFKKSQARSLSGFQKPLSVAFKNKIDMALNDGKTHLNATEVLDFITQDLSDFKLIENKPIIIQKAPYVVWRIYLVVDGIGNIWTLSDSNPPQILSKKLDIKH